MYILRMLNDYRVADEHTIIDASTGEMMQLQSDGQYLLTTSSVVDLKLTQKTTRLKRRFTPTMIAKLLESGTKVDDVIQPTVKEVVQVVQTPKVVQDLSGTDLESGTSYSINGTSYGTLREASTAVGTPVMTLKRWFDKGKDGYLKT